MIPKLYDGKENLIGELVECLRGVVIEERNGMFECEITYHIFSPLATRIERGVIIEAHANDTLLNQKFRVYKISKPLDGKFKVYARHISYDLLRDMIDGLDIENQSCEYVLNQIFRNSQFCQKFKGFSDIINAQNYKIGSTKCLRAIVGEQGSVIDTFGTGAEILRDNYNFHVLNSRGHDNEVTIEYRKNLTGFDWQIDDSDMITRIKPFAKYTNDNNEEVIVHASPKYVDSPRIFNYETPFIEEIDFSDKFKDNEIPTSNKLKLLAEQYFINNKCDIPKMSCKLSFIPLSKCVGFEGIADKISLCDKVGLKHELYGYTDKAKVIKTTYDFLKERYESMEIGEPKSTLGDLVGNGGGATVGPPGPPGPQGPAGADGNVGDFPDSLPDVPVLSSKSIGLASIELTWSYENKAYYNYELYASKTKDFSPNAFDLIFKGQASAFLHQVQPSETWYYRTRAVNSHGKATEFSMQVKAETFKIGDATNWFEEAAIGEALIGTLSADRAWVGKFSGHYIDARNLSVTDGNGKRTLDIDSFGNVNLDVTTLKIKSDNAVTKTELTTTAEKINNSITSIDGKYNTVTQEIKDGVNQFKVSVGQSGGSNEGLNTGFKSGNLQGWYIAMYEPVATHNSVVVLDDSSQWCLNGKNMVQVYGNNMTSGDYRVEQVLNLVKGETYTVSGLTAGRGNGFIRMVREDWGWLANHYVGYSEGGKDIGNWERFSFSFVAETSVCRIAIGITAYNGEGYRWATDIMINRGSVAQAWQPNASELHATDFIVDGTGATVRNGNFSIENKAGKKVFYGDTNGNVTLDGDMRIGKNFYLRDDGNIFSVDADAYFMRFRCDEPWTRSKEYPGRLNPIIQSRYGLYNGNWNGYAINQINWTDYNGFQAFEMWNTFTGRTERIALYKTYMENYTSNPTPMSLATEEQNTVDLIDQIPYLQVGGGNAIYDIEKLKELNPLWVKDLGGLSLNTDTLIPYLTKCVSEFKVENEKLNLMNEELVKKNNELLARLQVTQRALDELLLNILEV